MINIYSQNNTTYTKNGDATLIPISCELSLTINGAWKLTLEHPYDEEERYKYIVEGAIIQADVNCINELSATKQRFRIYDYKKGLNSVTAVAYPIAMESTHDAPIANLVISNKTGVQAMALLQAYTNKYTLSTDVTKTASTSYENTNVNAAIANGDDSCFIKKFGGEICYDNLNFMVKDRLGDTTPEDHPVAYGHNLTDIEYEKDDSGLITRIYPISKDGIRLNGSGYVNSPKINNYPIPHCRYMQAPYTLVNTDVSSPSAEAALTNQAKTAISSSATSTSQTGYANAINAGYEPEYVAKNYDSIREAVLNMALASIYDASMYSAFESAITSSLGWLSKLTQPEWTWMEVQSDGWRYGNANGYAKSRYVYVDRKWRYFGSDGYWQRPRDDGDDWDWYQPTGSSGRKYGNFNKYYAHNEYVYITRDGQMKEYWFDKSGWYDDDKSGDSNYTWQGSGTSADPWWFGDSSSSGKYLKDCWRFIDGTYYYFDSNGYYDGSTKKDNYQWDWNDGGSADQTWFGNAVNRAYAATYLTSQWCKIDGDWYYFDSNGYAIAQATSRSNLVAVFTTAMSGLTSLCNTWKTSLYNLLYSQMTAYCNAQFNTGIDVPVVTITVNMVDLSNTTEYEGYAHLESVKLGDSVKCIDSEHNISAIERVVGLKYNCITQEIIEVTIGVAGSSMMSILNVNASGSSVAGGFDTSIIESTLTSHGNSIASLQSNKQNKLTAGRGIDITNDVISSTSEGQGLLYWEESSTDFKRTVTEAIPNGWTFNQTYARDEIDVTIADNSTTRHWNASFTKDIPIVTCSWDDWLGFVAISDVADDVSYGGVRTSFTVDGKTLYYGGYGSALPLSNNAHFADSDGLIDIGHFDTYADALEYALELFDIKVGSYYKHTRIGIEDNIIEGGTRYDSEDDYPFYVDDEGNIHGNSFIKGGENGNDITDEFTGATSSADGTKGLVPQPLIADEAKFLKGDGTWSNVDSDSVSDLQDVELTNLTSGQILKYNSNIQKWVNANESGGGGGSSIVEIYQLTVKQLAGYTVTMTHEDGTAITKSVTTDNEVVTFELTKAGVWTLSNSKDATTVAHNVNVVSDTFISYAKLTKALTLDVESTVLARTFTCSTAGSYVVIIGTTGQGSQTSYKPTTITTTGSVTYDNTVFNSSSPTTSYWCSDIRVYVADAQANDTITITASGYDRGRIMIAHTDEFISEQNIVLQDTRKDSNFTGTFDMDDGDVANIFCLGTAGNTKSITGNDITITSKYNSDNMNYDYLEASDDTTVTVSYTGGTSYGSSGVVSII